MRLPRIVEAMNEIDDDLVSGAVEYRREPLSARLRSGLFPKACACLLAAAFVFAAVLLWGIRERTEPFTLTVYAAAADGTAEAEVLREGRKVPISLFETEEGLSGFVISCSKPDENLPSSVLILASGQSSQGYITEIRGITEDSTQNYYFYIPGEEEAWPYQFSLFMDDTEENMIRQYHIIITQADGSWYAELRVGSAVERVTEES